MGSVPQEQAHDETTALMLGAPGLNLDSMRPRWMSRGACRGQDTSTFFPRNGKSNRAKELCGACPVSVECLDFAMDAEHEEGLDMRHGIYGGLTGRERLELAQSEDELRGELEGTPERHSVTFPVGASSAKGR